MPARFVRDALAGDPATWAQTWATDSLAQARWVYSQLALAGPDEYRGFIVTPAEGFETRAAAIIEGQLLKGGTRLAILLEAIWP